MKEFGGPDVCLETASNLVRGQRCRPSWPNSSVCLATWCSVVHPPSTFPFRWNLRIVSAHNQESEDLPPIRCTPRWSIGMVLFGSFVFCYDPLQLRSSCEAWRRGSWTDIHQTPVENPNPVLDPGEMKLLSTTHWSSSGACCRIARSSTISFVYSWGSMWKSSTLVYWASSEQLCFVKDRKILHFLFQIDLSVSNSVFVTKCAAISIISKCPNLPIFSHPDENEWRITGFKVYF